MSEKNYIVHKDTVYEKVEKELYTAYKQCKVSQEKPNPQWKGPKIPFDLWSEMVAWCQVTQDKFKSEALVFLFLDLGNKKQPWSVWYPPQKTQGMTVQADDQNPQYVEQRRAYPDLQFGTLHHHCTTGAFASGTDKDDEVDREGLHFTIGKLGSDKHEVHYRFSIEGACYEGHVCDVVEMLPEVAKLPAKYARSVHSAMLHDPVDASLWDFSEPIKNVTKVSFQTRTYSPNPYAKEQAINRHIGRGGIGYGFENQQSNWYDDWFDTEEVEEMGEINENFLPKKLTAEEIASNESHMLKQSFFYMVADVCRVIDSHAKSPKMKEEHLKTLDYTEVYQLAYQHLNGSNEKLCEDLIDLAFEWTGYERGMTKKDEKFALECYKILKNDK